MWKISDSNICTTAAEKGSTKTAVSFVVFKRFDPKVNKKHFAQKPKQNNGLKVPATNHTSKAMNFCICSPFLNIIRNKVHVREK